MLDTSTRNVHLNLYSVANRKTETYDVELIACWWIARKRTGLRYSTTNCSSCRVRRKERKVKEEYLYSAFWPRRYTQSAQAWITQFYLQITPCLPFLRERSPDGTTTATEAADIQLQLTTNRSTPKG